MPCCRCNRTGSCKGCACVKAGIPCTNCLPSKLGSCVNSPHNSSRIQQPSTEFIPINAPLPTGPPASDADAASITISAISTSASDADAAAASITISGGGDHDGGDHDVDYCENSRPESTDLDPSSTRCTHSVTDTRESVCELPPYDATTDPHFVWGELDGETFAHSVDCCYAEIVHWRRNLFKIPSGKSGKSFVRELTRLFRAFGDNSALECVALKAAMVLPALLLQKPHARSKAKDHSTHWNAD